ncbi:MAG TPA: glycoside hydrolase family 15 protein [Kofleriaceae bacterium]|nr:glycoside hydrolase family 15 protein [Kofleriaceae bacterium]
MPELRDQAAHRDASARTAAAARTAAPPEAPAAETQPPIHDYALLGDGRSAALLSRGGSLDWLCWPRFDSPPLFGRLVDLAGGRWLVAPTGPARAARRYLADTNVVETVFEDAAGRCVAVDAMTVASEADKRHLLIPGHELLRTVRCERGAMELAIDVDPRPDFGRARARASSHRHFGIRWELANGLLALRSNVPLVLDGGRARATVVLRAGEQLTLSLTFDDEGPAVVPPLGAAAGERLARTVAWWRGWIARARYDGPYRELVRRSALALKLMSFAPSGAIIAAPTTSLPEQPGGPLNWDYRFCWLRDAAFTARALLSLGYVEEAQAFCGWLLHTTRLTRPQLRVLYDVYGKQPPAERTVGAASGYRGARPVRTGNAAIQQLQLDCYGEVIDATAQLARTDGALDRETRRLLRDFADQVARTWRGPDQGIWEPRGAPAVHTHSRLLCWVALDRLIELGDRGLVDRVDRARLAGERDAIRRALEADAYDRTLGAYTAVAGARDLDAAVLLMTWYGFHDGADPRMRSTYARVSERLGAGPGLLYRNDAGARAGEGAFWICSFWAVEHLTMGGGSHAEADRAMRLACAHASDLGLMAEQLDPATGDGLGNFPQAYTHVGLISAAVSLEERRRGTGPDPRVPDPANVERGR